MLAEFERKSREAESEAASIIAGAKAEAERMAEEAKTRMEDFVVRRTKMAEAKIAQAEAQAMADVRCRRRRHRGRRRREDPQRRRQGQSRRGSARERHRRRQKEVQLGAASVFISAPAVSSFIHGSSLNLGLRPGARGSAGSVRVGAITPERSDSSRKISRQRRRRSFFATISRYSVPGNDSLRSWADDVGRSVGGASGHLRLQWRAC